MVATEEQVAPSRLAAFESRNFRAYFVGQLVSTIGTWMQTFAQAWLVLDLTNSAGRLGVTVALQFLPLLLFGAHSGVLADRVDNRKLLMATSAVGAMLALGLGALSQVGHASIGVIYVFAGAFGLVTAVERPAMSAFIFQLVDRERLASAVGLNGIINTAGRLVGPSIAGVVIAVSSIAGCFYVNAASYLVVIAALALMRTDQMIARPFRARGTGGFREGMQYVRTNPVVARALLVMAIVGTVSYNFQTTIPPYVRYTFARGAGGTSAVMSVSAIGSIAAGLAVAGWRLHPRRSLGLSTAAFGFWMLVFGAVPTYALLVVVCIPLGFLSSAFLTVDTTVLQKATDPAMQGRVMGLHQMAWFGSTPIGAVLMGWVVEATSPRVPFFIGGATAVVVGLVVLAGRDQ